MKLVFDDDVMREKFPKVLVGYLGGEETIDMLVDHYVEGMTVRMLAEKHDCHPTHIHRQITAAKIKLRALGLLPAEWDKSQSCGTDKAVN